jgi:inner membrane protein
MYYMLNELLPPWLIWFLLGIALACSELFMPAFILFFFGIGCLGVACVLLFWDITLNQQLLVFLLITIGSLVILRKTLIRIFRGVRTDSQDKEFDDFPYKERVVVLRAILPPNPGRVQHRGTAWDAVADEAIAAGETVEIVGHAENSRQTFHVSRVQPSS